MNLCSCKPQRSRREGQDIGKHGCSRQTANLLHASAFELSNASTPVLQGVMGTTPDASLARTVLTLHTTLPISAVKSSKKGSLPCSHLKSLIHRLSTPKSTGSALDICDRCVLRASGGGTYSSFDGCAYGRSATVLGQTRVWRNRTVTTAARCCRRLRCRRPALVATARSSMPWTAHFQ